MDYTTEQVVKEAAAALYEKRPCLSLHGALNITIGEIERLVEAEPDRRMFDTGFFAGVCYCIELLGADAPPSLAQAREAAISQIIGVRRQVAPVAGTPDV